MLAQQQVLQLKPLKTKTSNLSNKIFLNREKRHLRDGKYAVMVCYFHGNTKAAIIDNVSDDTPDKIWLSFYLRWRRFLRGSKSLKCILISILFLGSFIFFFLLSMSKFDNFRILIQIKVKSKIKRKSIICLFLAILCC